MDAFLVRLSVSQWTARKLDKSATRDTKERAGAGDKAAVKVYKTILAANELTAIDTIVNQARAEHRNRTVPWAYDGPGAITAAGYPAYKARMADLEKQFNLAVSTFVTAYERDRHDLLTNSNNPIRLSMGKLFNPADYPTPGDLRSRFAFTVHAEPMPQADDFRVNGLAPEHVQEIKNDIKDNNAQALQNANNTAWGRVIEKVEHLKQKLAGYKPGDRLFDSMIDNISELISLLPSINITNDPDLTRIGQKLTALTAYSVADMREDAALRAEVSKTAGVILAQIGEVYQRAA